ncbi:hypothetical protein [Streptomyces sp. NPDC002685]|uniref:hypothetical protein n=1 Tax=Streptomyces sp. NPDC002685 TaxID=3154540 RepID=UPI003317FEFE
MDPQLRAAALNAAAATQDTDDTLPFEPVPDGYYARPEATAAELDEALAKVGLYRTARSL